MLVKAIFRTGMWPGLAVAFTLSAWGGTEYPAKTGETVAANQLIVRLKAGTAPGAVIPGFLSNAKTQALNLPNVYLISAASIPAGISTLLAAHPLVDFVEPNRVRRIILSAPNDPGYINSTGGEWGLFTIQALQAWNYLQTPYLTSSTAGTGRVKVAVLDTGVDCTHPDFINSGGSSTDAAFGGQLVWSASQALVGTSLTSPVCAWQDDHGHGTHVTGIVAAATGNGTGISSLGYQLQVIEYKVLDASGSGSDTTIADAIVAATNAGARVVSMSLGGNGYSQTLQTAINYAWQHNTVVVAAAGNNSSSSLFFPGGANHAVGVSATDINNNLASFSNFGSYVSLGAPGVSIVSTVPTYSVTLGCCNYGGLSGTSMATPFVAALAGLIATGTPNTSAAAIVQRMEQSALTNTAGGAWGQNFGYGIINAYNAVAGIARATSTGGVVGQITDSSGNALGGAQIIVGSQSFTTDPSGLYWIRPLAAGTYPVTVSAPGFSTLSLSVTVAAGADTPFSPAIGIAYGNFAGTVTDRGSGVSGAVVQALLNGVVTGTAVTDANGQYTLWVPAASGYTVQISRAGSSTTTLSSFAVPSGGSTNVNVILPSLLGAIAGVVRYTNGTAIAGVPVAVSSSIYSASAVTDANGNYTVAGLPPGTYSVTASPSGTSPSTQAGVPVSADAAATCAGVVATEAMVTAAAATVNFQFDTPPAAAPTFSPAAGTYVAAQSVTISSATPGASIRYTTDGSTPTSTAGTLYSGPIPVAATTTINAVAYTSLIPISPVASATYTITPNVWYSVSWIRRKAVTIDHTKVSGGATLTNFPVLIAITDANLQSGAKADGSDILFTAADGVTKLNHEIESYNGATGQLVAWVKAPSVSPAVDTVVYLYYGNAGAGNQQNAAGVWDGSYGGVWHLGNGTSVSGADATGNGNTGTNNGATAVAGEIVGGAHVSGGANVSFGNGAQLSPASAITVSAWVNIAATDGSYHNLVYKHIPNFSTQNNGGYALWRTNSASQTFRFDVGSGTTGYVAYSGSYGAGWHHVVGTFDGSVVRMYVDGVAQGTAAYVGTIGYAGTAGLTVGYNPANAGESFNGTLDEVRVAGVARSVGWIATEYGNENAPGTFVHVGTEESQGTTGTYTVTSAPAGLSLTVDGAGCTTPCTYQWTTGTNHSIGAATQSGVTGVQYVFGSWSDAGAATHTVTAATPATYTASFTTQYFLTTAASPGAGGTISPASGWYNSGAVVGVSATAAGGYQFTGFSGALTGTVTPQNVTMTAPATVTANFAVSTVSITVTSTPAGLQVTVDGAGCTTPCTYQWTTGTSHSIGAATQSGATGVQYVFGSWSDAGAATHTVIAATPATYTASFTTQYFLTTAASPAAGGTISPSSGWYNSGTVLAVSVTAAGGYQFKGFTGALTGTVTPQNVTMTAPATVTANFRGFTLTLPVVW